MISISESIKQLLKFKMSRDEMLQFNIKHLKAGLLGTWIAGMGRYWDDSDANILQHLGLGSLIYIFLLAGFIWLILLPFKVEKWNYFTVLTFISLTSFPAILYAIPVELFFSMDTANAINVWFLAIIASWRQGLLYYFLKHFTRLSPGNILTVTLMPICLIISTLTVLNLHRAVFAVMGGVRGSNPHESSYMVLVVLTGISMILTLPLLFAYGAGIYNSRQKNKPEN